MGRTSRIILGGMLLASWIYSPGREFQILCLRLLFGQTQISPTTYVQGQPPGCLVYHYPNVQLTEERKKELAADAIASPDSFMVACNFMDHHVKWPPPALWDGHPHVPRLCAWIRFASFFAH